MKRHLCPGYPLFQRSGMQCHRSRTSLLAAVSKHCHAALPAKISTFKSHMWQNA